MATCEVIKIGDGENAVVVNKRDYDKGFPDNENLKKRVDELQSEQKALYEKAKQKAAKAAVAKAKKAADAMKKADEEKGGKD